MSDERSMYELANKALTIAQAAEGCIKNFPHTVDEAQALATLSLAYSTMADIAGHCSNFNLPGGAPHD